jgi:transcriptional regulator with XRE-family HTH domain
MKFSEKLQSLRKESKLSQEQLASMLDVSRQSVSKWESGQTYPEMDKLLELTKIFKCSLDDLTNDEIKNVGVSKSKNYINTIVDEVVGIVNKSIDTFKKLSSKQILKYITLFIFIILLITILFNIPFNYLIELGMDLFSKLGTTGTIMYSLWKFILNLSYFIIIMFILIYLYKTRFLDRFDEIEIEEKVENIKPVKAEEKETIEKDLNIKEKPIRSQRFALIDFFASIIIFFIKFITLILAVFLLFVLFALFLFVYIVIFFMINGVISIGVLLGIIFSIMLCGLFIDIMFKFVFNKKNNFYITFIVFIVSIAGLGLSSGILITEVSKYDFINKAPEINYTKEYAEYEFSNDIVIEHNYYGYDYEYIPTEENINKIIIEYSYYKDYVYVEFVKENNKINIYQSARNYSFGKREINILIEDFKNKKIHNYSLLSNVKIKVYTSSANIEKLKKNYDNHIINEKEENEEVLFSEYDNRINELESRNYELENKIYNLEEKNNELNSKIEQYKNRINELLDL